MKQPLSVRIDADLLAAARECARQDNRTLTNFIETALISRIALMTQDRAGTGPAIPRPDRKEVSRGV